MSVDCEELTARLEGVRAYRHDRMPGFAECAPSGRLRLDAIACWLQDVAYADVEDAGLVQAAVWVVRRTRIRVNRFPRFGDRFRLTTFCSGLGRMWAERRTDIVRISEGVPEPEPQAGLEAAVQAVSLWIHLDPERWVPSRLTAPELAVYGGTRLTERRINHRLRHPGPEPDAIESAWSFRATECDIADHVNNAAYWAPLEEELLNSPEPEPEHIDAEIEYRTPAQPGPKRVLAAGDRRWIVGRDGELHASLRLGGH